MKKKLVAGFMAATMMVSVMSTGVFCCIVLIFIFE